ncbi:hypothetical protein N7468_009025 [Penicillium chermesinum]|uniref:Zn(2)-C6 fungal-type domain-containing protein n=1 Tax=Penicillium chermesinum TaxID=63820 RepID=A0A9W9NH74_9EURO|nr:uncharacterized protein N7468_009025 [Penicillium chermesinum]KAJ5219821.1 hypothetical protein N7468_009025 [Penicillium chermesinum]
MAARQSTPASEHSHSGDGVRKRVCKACDRCRLKKSKCDGSSPCSRCRADNAICVFGERKKAHDKVYPKGYVEMLEQQQVWLVNGLQELYRRSLEGEGWPGEALKGERFEENPEAMQQDLWRHGMQRQESSDSSSEPHSPARTRFSDAFSQQNLPPTPPAYHSSPPAPIKLEPEPMMANPQYAPAMQGVVNPLALQGGQWSSGFGPFDEIEMMPSADYANLAFDDQITSPMFSRQMPMGCISSNEYEDFNQFLNPNPTEITSV